jgi:hypothetical protein
MKKSELKALIKECVRETLFEEGVLSGIVAEVASGILRSRETITEETTMPTALQARVSEEQKEDKRKKLLETKRKMLDAIGSANANMSNVFEGTEPLSSAGSVSSGPQAQGPLAGIDPNDAGIDITGLMGLAGRKWQQLK